jgi:hypothetical protein
MSDLDPIAATRLEGREDVHRDAGCSKIVRIRESRYSTEP